MGCDQMCMVCLDTLWPLSRNSALGHFSRDLRTKVSEMTTASSPRELCTGSRSRAPKELLMKFRMAVRCAMWGCHSQAPWERATENVHAHTAPLHLSLCVFSSASPEEQKRCRMCKSREGSGLNIFSGSSGIRGLRKTLFLLCQ